MHMPARVRYNHSSTDTTLHASGKYPRTGSLHRNRVLNTSLMTGDGAERICKRASSSQAFMSVLRAWSPSPKRADTAASERGSG